MAMYDPVTDQFTYYTPVEIPKVTIEDPLFGNFDLPEGYRLGETGNYIAPANTPETKEQEYDFSKMNEVSQTHSDPNQDFDVYSEDLDAYNDFDKEDFKIYQKNNPTVSYTSNTKNYKVNSSLQGNKKRAMDFFQSKGLSPIQAAGIVGNLITESSLNTKAIGDGGKSLGIAQWNGSRRRNLEAFAKRRKSSIYDLNTQLEFLWWEITEGDQKKFKILEGLKNSKSIEQAAESFMNRFERPGIPRLRDRINHAKKLLS